MKKASSPQVGSATDNLVVEAATFIGIDFHKRYSVFHTSPQIRVSICHQGGPVTFSLTKR